MHHLYAVVSNLTCWCTIINWLHSLLVEFVTVTHCNALCHFQTHNMWDTLLKVVQITLRLHYVSRLFLIWFRSWNMTAKKLHLGTDDCHSFIPNAPSLSTFTFDSIKLACKTILRQCHWLTTFSRTVKLVTVLGCFFSVITKEHIMLVCIRILTTIFQILPVLITWFFCKLIFISLLIGNHIYLHQGGYVLPSICLLVCLPVYLSLC